MQPRRNPERETGREGKPSGGGQGFAQGDESSYEAVKPVGYEARLAFEREQAARRGGARPAVPGQPAYAPPDGQAHAARSGYPPPAAAPQPHPMAGRIYRPAQGGGLEPRPGMPPQTAPMPRQGTSPQRSVPPQTAPMPRQGTGAQPALFPEDVPMERSPELMEKRGDFWKPVGEQREKTGQKPRRNRIWLGVLLFLGVALAVGMVVRGVVFTVRAAQVSGNAERTDEQILKAAGISLGQNMFALDAEAIARRVNSDHYLQFEQLRMDWPDGVTLFVTERTPVAYANAYGMLYILAADGTVLENSDDIDNLPELPMVQGFQEGNIVVGKKVAPSASARLRAYTSIVEELSIQGCLSQIQELNISQLDNIFLVTVDGYTVLLGDGEDIRAKVGAMRAVRLKLLEMEKSGGTINVSEDPVHPTYMP